MRLVYTESTGAEMPVNAVQIFATEEETSIVMRGYAGGIGGRWPLILFVSSVEHYFHAIKFEQRPTEVVAGARRGDKFEAQHVAVEMDGGWHVENLEQWSETSDINRHGIHLFASLGAVSRILTRQAAGCNNVYFFSNLAHGGE